MSLSNKSFIRVTLYTITLLSLLQFSNARTSKCQKTETKLEKILTACAQYCDSLKEARLNFTCTEEIEERIYHPFITIRIDSFRTYKRELNKYIYDYQLIKEGNTITEQRILLKDRGEDKHEKDSELKTQRFDYKLVINGPIGVIDSNWQRHFDYRISGNEVIDNKRTVVLEASPKSTSPVEHLFGRIWVDSDDYSILKIEWNQTSLGNYEAITKTAEELNAEPNIKLCSEYFYEKNGIRFPSQYIIEE
ncbi:MAG: hypothetical protein JW870_02405, partial [Candidatus Delongbacteria bacterium]|nr:hypothetical protein [Candidatus Delongbacteria bacterium]